MTVRRNRWKRVSTSTILPEANFIAERLNCNLLTSISPTIHSDEIDDRFRSLVLQDASRSYGVFINCAQFINTTSDYKLIPDSLHYMSGWVSGLLQNAYSSLAILESCTKNLHRNNLAERGEWTLYVHPVDRKRVMTVDKHGVFWNRMICWLPLIRRCVWSFHRLSCHLQLQQVYLQSTEGKAMKRHSHFHITYKATA